MTFAADPATQPSWREATSPRDWSFPRDHGRHDGFKTEWWYFTGNLRDRSGRAFGYQLTFFRTAFVPGAVSRPSAWAMKDIYFAHAAITDLKGQSFTFIDRLERGRPGLALASDAGLDVRLADWSLIDEAGTIRLRAKDKSMEIELNCSGGRGPFLQGPGGVNAKGREPGQASYYYSVTRLETSGDLTVGQRRYHVSGHSWMDHEFSSNALAPSQVGWDWMGLELSDGDDLMIYRLRDRLAANDFLSGTLVTRDGVAHYLSAADISLKGSKPAKSAATGASYPQEWQLTVRGKQPMTVRSRLATQELVTPSSTDVTYFEGSAEVLDSQGKSAGEGYLEMTGYAKPLGGT